MQRRWKNLFGVLLKYGILQASLCFFIVLNDFKCSLFWKKFAGNCRKSKLFGFDYFFKFWKFAGILIDF